MNSGEVSTPFTAWGQPFASQIRYRTRGRPVRVTTMRSIPHVCTPTRYPDLVANDDHVLPAAANTFRRSLPPWPGPEHTTEAPMSANYRAAWVPEQEYRPWEDATAIAVAYVDLACMEQRNRGLLVTETADGAHYTPSLQQFVARHGRHVTRRSRRNDPYRNQGPILVYVPNAELLDLAAHYARVSSLCAVESASFRLDGWAAATGALNLDTGEQAPAVLAEVRQLLDRIAFYGNNGWGDPFGKTRTRQLLNDLRTLDSLNADFITSYMIGKGRSGKGVIRLHAMVESMVSTGARQHQEFSER